MRSKIILKTDSKIIIRKKIVPSMKSYNSRRISIDKALQKYFNPVNSGFYVHKKDKRNIKIIFLNGRERKTFNAKYLYQGTKKENSFLQGFHYGNDFIEELKKCCPTNNEFLEIEFDIENPCEVIVKPIIECLYEEKLLEEDFGVNEGEITEETRKVIKRCNTIIKKAKGNFIQKHGSLYCEVCGFDFYKVYGELGKDFIEGHHKNPLCERNGQEMTKIDDIALVCSNCHRMLHRKENISIEALKNIIQNTARKD